MNYTTEYQDYPTINRGHKDTLFRMVFSKKKDLLDLYNTINNTHYTNSEALEINTLENAIYMSMKNDAGTGQNHPASIRCFFAGKWLFRM